MRRGEGKLIWVAGLCAAMMSSRAHANASAKRIAIVFVGGNAEDADAKASLPGLLAAEIHKHAGYDTVAEADVRAALEKQAISAPACALTPKCRAAMGQALKASWLLIATLNAEGDKFNLTVRVLTPDNPDEETRGTETMRRLKNLGQNVPIVMSSAIKWEVAEEPKPAAEPKPPPPAATIAAPPRSPAKAAPPAEKPAPLPAAPIVAKALLPSPISAVAAAPPERQRVMILEMQEVGLDRPMAATLPDAIANAIGRHPGYDVTSAAEVKEMLALDKDKKLLGCDEDSGCMTEISKKLNANFVLRGTLGKLGERYVLSLSLLDAKDAKNVRKSSDTYASVELVGKGAPNAVAKLFGWSGDESARPKFRLPKTKKMSFAIFDLHASGVAEDVTKNLTQILSSEVKNVEGASVVGRDDILALLQFDKDKSRMGCTEDTECMASIGGALGVDRMVVGSIGKLSDDYVVALRLVDVRHAEVENRYTETFRGSEEQLIGATRHAARELLGIEAVGSGKLAVTASQPATEVFVDNTTKGKLPLPPIEKLDPGRHTVRLAREGFFDWQSDIYVNPLETSTAWAQLKERPEKWYQKWWVWTIAGSLLAGGSGITAWQVIAHEKTPAAVGTVGLQ